MVTTQSCTGAEARGGGENAEAQLLHLTQTQ